ncbi:MAG: hypothetical protein PHC69_04150, partial [Ruminiclostridium sp.]|nr:hypothetical protein [Ruminiclostridium sp.]
GRWCLIMIASNSFKQGIAVDSLYLSSQHKEAVARLKYVVNSKRFGVLSGHPGTGLSMRIYCSYDSPSSKKKEVWECRLDYLKNYGSTCEIQLSSQAQPFDFPSGLLVSL